MKAVAPTIHHSTLPPPRKKSLESLLNLRKTSPIRAMKHK